MERGIGEISRIYNGELVFAEELMRISLSARAVDPGPSHHVAAARDGPAPAHRIGCCDAAVSRRGPPTAAQLWAGTTFSNAIALANSNASLAHRQTAPLESGSWVLKSLRLPVTRTRRA